MEKELQEIKKSIQNECISQGEIAYLESHKQEVLATGDIELCQWAGITEEEYNAGALNLKARALADFLEVGLEEIAEGTCYDNSLTCDGAEYIVLTDEQADARAKEEILNSLWAFNADFVISHCKNYNDMSQWEVESAIESLRHAQENCCENANGLVYALIDDMDEFVEDAIDADGRGNFISRYDGVENEQDGYYIYRVD